MALDSPITIVRGNDEKIAIPVKDGDAGGFISDLSVYQTITYALSDRQEVGSVVIQKTDADADLVVQPAGDITSQELTDTGVGDTDDVIVVTLTQTETEGLGRSVYWHEVRLKDSEDIEKTVMGPSKVTIDPSAL